jgi:hypothetical protein
VTAANQAPHSETPRLRPVSRRLRFQAVLVLLTAIVVYAAVQEIRKSGPDAHPHVQEHAFSDRRPALTAAEERFSQALWNIHAEVRTAAVRMTFAGLAYKIGNADVASVRTKVAPLTETFRQAAADLSKLEGPESMQAVRSRYAEAVRLFSEASQTMVRVTEDGNEVHLLTAQQMSEQAAGMLLEVGDQLWPGEIKPN